MLEEAILEAISIEVKLDPSPDLSHLGYYSEEYAEGCVDLLKFNEVDSAKHRYFHADGDVEETVRLWKRMDEYEKDKWQMVVVTAVALIEANGRSTIVTSPGVPGIESDSHKDYFYDTGKEEVLELTELIAFFGFHPISIIRHTIKAVEDFRESFEKKESKC